MKTALRFGLPAVIATAATAGLLLGIVPETTRAGKPVAEACRGSAPSPEDIIAARSGGKSLPKPGRATRRLAESGAGLGRGVGSDQYRSRRKRHHLHGLGRWRRTQVHRQWCDLVGR